MALVEPIDILGILDAVYMQRARSSRGGLLAPARSYREGVLDACAAKIRGRDSTESV